LSLERCIEINTSGTYWLACTVIDFSALLVLYFTCLHFCKNRYTPIGALKYDSFVWNVLYLHFAALIVL